MSRQKLLKAFCSPLCWCTAQRNRKTHQSCMWCTDSGHLFQGGSACPLNNSCLCCFCSLDSINILQQLCALYLVWAFKLWQTLGDSCFYTDLILRTVRVPNPVFHTRHLAAWLVLCCKTISSHVSAAWPWLTGHLSRFVQNGTDRKCGLKKLAG